MKNKINCIEIGKEIFNILKSKSPNINKITNIQSKIKNNICPLLFPKKKPLIVKYLDLLVFLGKYDIITNLIENMNVNYYYTICENNVILYDIIF